MVVVAARGEDHLWWILDQLWFRLRQDEKKRPKMIETCTTKRESSYRVCHSCKSIILKVDSETTVGHVFNVLENGESSQYEDGLGMG